MQSIKGTEITEDFFNIDSPYVGTWETAEGYYKQFTYDTAL